MVDATLHVLSPGRSQTRGSRWIPRGVGTTRNEFLCSGSSARLVLVREPESWIAAPTTHAQAGNHKLPASLAGC